MPRRRNSKGSHVKSKRQVRYLLSNGSPLTPGQKARLKTELHSGAVTIKASRRRRR